MACSFGGRTKEEYPTMKKLIAALALSLAIPFAAFADDKGAAPAKPPEAKPAEPDKAAEPKKEEPKKEAAKTEPKKEEAKAAPTKDTKKHKKAPAAPATGEVKKDEGK